MSCRNLRTLSLKDDFEHNLIGHKWNLNPDCKMEENLKTQIASVGGGRKYYFNVVQ